MDNPGGTGIGGTGADGTSHKVDIIQHVTGADSEVIIVYVTVPSKEEGMKIASELVTRGLVACVNMIAGVTSIY